MDAITVRHSSNITNKWNIPTTGFDILCDNTVFTHRKCIQQDEKGGQTDCHGIRMRLKFFMPLTEELKDGETRSTSNHMPIEKISIEIKDTDLDGNETTKITGVMIKEATRTFLGDSDYAYTYIPCTKESIGFPAPTTVNV